MKVRDRQKRKRNRGTDFIICITELYTSSRVYLHTDAYIWGYKRNAFDMLSAVGWWSIGPISHPDSSDLLSMALFIDSMNVLFDVFQYIYLHFCYHKDTLTVVTFRSGGLEELIYE